MKKFFLIAVCLIAFTGAGYAEEDYIANPRIDLIIAGEQELDAATIVGNASVGGDLAVTGDTTLEGSPAVMFTVLSAPTVGSDYVLTNRTPLSAGELVYSVSNVVSAATGAGTTGTVGFAIGATVNDWVILK